MLVHQLATCQIIPPDQLNASTISSSAIQLTWTDNSSNETGFKIERSLSSDMGFESFAIVQANSVSVVDHGLSANTTYFYRVVAFNDTEDSTPADAVSVTTEDDGSTLPYYWNNTDIGSTNLAGSASYENGFFQTSGNGILNATTNSFHFVYQSLEGDGEIIAQLVTMRRAHWDHQGLMIKESLEPSSAYAMNELYLDLNVLIFKGRNNGEFFSLEDSSKNYEVSIWLKLTREGDTFIASYSGDGESWVETFRETIDMASNALIGVVSHASTDDKLSPATWRDVTVSQSNITAPSQLTTTPSTLDEIILSWEDNSNNETGFRIERAIKGDTIIFEDLVEVAANSTSFQDDGLTPGATYFYRVRAINGNRSSFASNEETAEVLTIPNTSLFMERKAGNYDRTSLNNTISVTTTADTVHNVLRHPGMNGKEVNVSLSSPVSSLDGAISLKITPYSHQQTTEFFTSESVKVSQVGGDLAIEINGIQNTYDVLLDSITCNHIVLNFNNEVMTPYVNGTYFESVNVGSFDLGSFTLDEYNGNVWDVIMVNTQMSNQSIYEQSERCTSGVEVSESPLSGYPYRICGVYNCVWVSSESELNEERKRAYLKAHEIAYDRNTFDVGMYIQPDIDEWIKSERNIPTPGGFEYFNLNTIFTKNQSNTSYWLHENFHGYQVPLLKGGKWLAEATAEWAAWSFYEEATKGYSIAAFTLNPHMGIYETFPSDSEFYHEVVRFYHSSVMLAYITTYLSDESLMGTLYNTQGVEVDAFLQMIELLEEEGHDFDTEFTEFAARTSIWDYPDPQMSEEFKATERNGINNGFPDYKFVETYPEEGTYGVYQPVPEALLPGPYGWNTYRIDSAAASTYTIKIQGSDQNPETLNFVCQVVKGVPGNYEYIDFPIDKEVTLGTGESEIEFSTEAGEELYLVVVAVSRDKISNENIDYIYEYAIESSEHPLPNDHFKTFSLADETAQAIIDHDDFTIRSQVTRGTDITKLSPVFTLSEGATSTPSNEETVNFNIPVTYSVTGAGNTSPKEWTVSVSAEPFRSETDFIAFELEDIAPFASIDEDAHVIIANLESDINVQNVVPVFTLSDGATSQPASGEAIDLTNPVSYMITAEDGITTQEWILSAADFRPFITSWEISEPNTEISFSLNENYDFNFTYVWRNSDGSAIETGSFTSSDGEAFSTTFATTGTYNLEIIGEFPQFSRYPVDNLDDVLQWGDVHWENLSLAFESWHGENFSTTDLPNLRKVSSMNSMFRDAKSFGGDLSQWDVSSVTNMGEMFSSASAFNSDISNWDVSSLESADEMFRETRAFNADISRWNTENLVNTDQMFFSASAFDRSLGDWNISNVTTMEEMLRSSGLSTLNYDRTLIGWSSQVVKQEVNLGAQGLDFCAGEEARDELISEFSWTITDGSSNCTEGDGTDILRFTVAEQIAPAVFDDANHTISIPVQGGSDIAALRPVISLSRGATSIPGTEELVDFSQQVVFKVTSEDSNTTQDWVVTVEEAANTETDIITFVFEEATGPVFINTDNHVVSLKVASGTNLTELRPDFSLSSGATSIPSTQETLDFSQSASNPVVYTVTAEDGISKQNWQVIVSKVLSNEPLSSEAEKALFNVYPNPSKDYIHLETTQKSTSWIVDLKGRQVLPAKKGNSFVFNLEKLKNGLYLLMIQTDSYIIQKKILKEE